MTPEQIRRLLEQLLDHGFDQAVDPVLRAAARVLDTGGSSALGTALAQLDAEVARLAASGARLSVDNPVLRAVWGDLETALDRQARLISDASSKVLESALNAAGTSVRQYALPGFSDAELEALNMRWIKPDPEVVARVVDYTRSAAWRQQMQKYAVGSFDDIQTSIFAHILDGHGGTVPRYLRNLIENAFIKDASTLIRTMQMTAYRDAAVIHRMANADILEKHIRIATLDDRCCMGCIGLHGTELRLNERVDDHHNGRCDSISIVKGFPLQIETGESWFARQSPERKRALMGGANYAAYQDGKVALKDFIGRRKDDVFGPQIYELSLKGVLGDGAKDYYGR